MSRTRAQVSLYTTPGGATVSAPQLDVPPSIAYPWHVPPVRKLWPNFQDLQDATALVGDE